MRCCRIWCPMIKKRYVGDINYPHYCLQLSSFFTTDNSFSNIKCVTHILSFICHMKYFQSEEASRDIEQFVAAQAREEARQQLTGGCRTVHSRTLINTRASEEEDRRRASEDTKLLGNTAFRQGQFSRAEELYTSALLQYDKVTRDTVTHSPHYPHFALFRITFCSQIVPKLDWSKGSIRML